MAGRGSVYINDTLERLLLRGGGRGLSAAVRELVADGLRWRMTRHHKPVAPRFLGILKPRAICDLYAAFSDAVAAEAGVPGILGGRHRLEAVPPATRYADEGGCTVYLVLRDDEILSAVDGEIYARRMLAETPERRAREEAGDDE